ncbi:hypothetical protein SK128_017005, partial [Halocaridina rubra]
PGCCLAGPGSSLPTLGPILRLPSEEEGVQSKESDNSNGGQSSKTDIVILVTQDHLWNWEMSCRGQIQKTEIGR